MSELSRVPSLPSQPELLRLPGIAADAIGARLQSSLIWAGAETGDEAVAVTFRKTFLLGKAPNRAALSIFADARYILWVNGRYVDRGPCRFQPNGPEYDVLEIAPHLDEGKNALAVLVVGNLTCGKVMRHAPGLAAVLVADADEVLKTDDSWKCTRKNPWQKVESTWADVLDSHVDARIGDGDWTVVAYEDHEWESAIGIDGQSWGPLTARRIPLLRESPVPIKSSVELPASLTPGQSVRFQSGRIVQAYPVVSFTADAGTELEIIPYKTTYIAREGRQTYFPIDSKGITEFEIAVRHGRATLDKVSLVERVYPFSRLGKFHCNDPILNKLWDMCARSCELLSEDAYVDCADRERVEWMDTTPPLFDITQTAMAGPPGPDGKEVFSDPRLLGALVRRTALTLQPEGWVKAHTCSDRYDLHAKMEDRSCAWVEGLRLYYEATSDRELLKEVWPAVVAQMDFFLKLRGDWGLVSCRDWVVWDNPLSYATGQTTTINAFIQRALVDSAYLASAIGENADAARFAKEAEDFAEIINRILWDEKSGSYFSSVGDVEILPGNQMFRQTIDLAKQGDFFEPTLHSNIFALDRGLVPPERRERVIDAILRLLPQKITGSIMVYYYVIKQLYALDRRDLDERVLAMFRQGWQAMANHPWQCSWEFSEVEDGHSKAHSYGMFPGCFLSSYVLGVRRTGLLANRQILIEPHLGGLCEAEGAVVTEFGPVPVSWRQAAGELHFQGTIPRDTRALLSLPASHGREEILLHGTPHRGTPRGTRLSIDLQPGDFAGVYKFSFQ
jgi:alpha-L-rhamnosidase